MRVLDKVAIRLGVTGTRNLPFDVQGALSAHVTAALNMVAAATSGSSQTAIVRILSPLAEGADRFVARLALAVPLWAIRPKMARQVGLVRFSVVTVVLLPDFRAA